jgi:hypothetical protein
MKSEIIENKKEELVKSIKISYEDEKLNEIGND